MAEESSTVVPWTNFKICPHWGKILVGDQHCEEVTTSLAHLWGAPLWNGAGSKPSKTFGELFSLRHCKSEPKKLCAKRALGQYSFKDAWSHPSISSVSKNLDISITDTLFRHLGFLQQLWHCWCYVNSLLPRKILIVFCFYLTISVPRTYPWFTFSQLNFLFSIYPKLYVSIS